MAFEEFLSELLALSIACYWTCCRYHNFLSFVVFHYALKARKRSLTCVLHNFVSLNGHSGFFAV